MAIECYKVEWTKPYPFKEAVNRPEARQIGIYAIYRSAGSKKPQYIGKSQELGRRLGEHQQGFSHTGVKDTKKIFYSFGTIYSLSGSITTADISPQQLRDVESFFINELQPLGNDIATKKHYKGISLIVINTGKPVPFSKVMAHNKDLLKLLKTNLTLTRTRTEIMRVGLFG